MEIRTLADILDRSGDSSPCALGADDESVYLLTASIGYAACPIVQNVATAPATMIFVRDRQSSREFLRSHQLRSSSA